LFAAGPRVGPNATILQGRGLSDIGRQLRRTARTVGAIAFDAASRLAALTSAGLNVKGVSGLYAALNNVRIPQVALGRPWDVVPALNGAGNTTRSVLAQAEVARTAGDVQGLNRLQTFIDGQFSLVKPTGRPILPPSSGIFSRVDVLDLQALADCPTLHSLLLNRAVQQFSGQKWMADITPVRMREVFRQMASAWRAEKGIPNPGNASQVVSASPNPGATANAAGNILGLPAGVVAAPTNASQVAQNAAIASSTYPETYAFYENFYRQALANEHQPPLFPQGPTGPSFGYGEDPSVATQGSQGGGSSLWWNNAGEYVPPSEPWYESWNGGEFYRNGGDLGWLPNPVPSWYDLPRLHDADKPCALCGERGRFADASIEPRLALGQFEGTIKPGQFYKSSLINATVEKGKQGWYGEVHLTDTPFRLRISNGYGGGRAAISLAHEFVHVLNNLLKLGLSHDQTHSAGVLLATEYAPMSAALQRHIA
jgi:hypothetical protein